uniref:Uncharacterized protein n=1 Tax=Panagrolaimus superbus TaxID=310955 RepID=A0A914Z504_9BILA
MLIIPRQPKWSNNLREIIISRRHLGTSANALEYCQEAATTWAKKNSAIFIIPDYWKSDEVKAGFLKLKEHQIKVLGLIPKERKDADVLRESLSNDSIDASICSNEKEATEHIKKFDPKIKVSTPKQNVKTSQASLSASNEHSNLTEPQIKSPKIAEALPSISNAPTIATVSETENKKDKTPPRVLRPRTTSKN